MVINAFLVLVILPNQSEQLSERLALRVRVQVKPKVKRLVNSIKIHSFQGIVVNVWVCICHQI
jgi:Iap family predicted aminopeptidase